LNKETKIELILKFHFFFKKNDVVILQKSQNCFNGGMGQKWLI
jgi:hypothetical protein